MLPVRTVIGRPAFVPMATLLATLHSTIEQTASFLRLKKLRKIIKKNSYQPDVSFFLFYPTKMQFFIIKKIQMKSLLQMFSFAALSCFIVSCSTTIPDMDVTPPTISMRIVGPGVNRTFNTQAEADRVQINLQHGQTYTITAIVSDNGGVANSSLAFASNSYLFFNAFQTGTGVALIPDRSDPWRIFRTSGDRSNPLTALIIKGSFTVHSNSGLLAAFSIDASGSDFGGSAGSRNSSYMRLNVLTERTGGIINWY